MVFFRNGDPVKYQGDLTQERKVFKWLTDPKNVFMPNVIEEVNDLMLAKMLKSEPSMFVFFYEETDIFSRKILRDLETMDDRLDSQDIEIVKICDDGIDEDYELGMISHKKSLITIFGCKLEIKNFIKKFDIFDEKNLALVT